MNDQVFRKAVLCVVEANQLSSKIAEEFLRYREGQSSTFGGLASGFFRIALRLEGLASGKELEKFNWSAEEKAALIKLLKIGSEIPDPALVTQIVEVNKLFFPEGYGNG